MAEIEPKLILDNLLEGCQIIGFDYQYLYVNEAVVRQSKKTKKQLLGNTMMAAYPGIEKTTMFRALSYCMDRRRPKTLENEFKFPDGSSGWFELRMEPVPQGALIFSIDITERKNVENRLKELNDTKNKFITIVSHQLRTPINVMLWNLEKLQNALGLKLDKSQLNAFTDIFGAGKQLTTRIDDLLTAIDIEESRINLKKQPGKLDDILRSVITDFKESFKAKKIKLSVTYPNKPLPALPLDTKRMEAVLSKLIDNALIYTEANGKVDIALGKTGNKIIFEVKDTGIGIPDSEQSKVFDIFERAANASKMHPDTSGVGLFIAKHFVLEHGGKISFESKENKGSRFWVEIPKT